MIVRLLAALALLLALAAPASAMQKRTSNVTDQAGNIIGTASVGIYISGTTTLATIYSDNGVTAMANPIVVSPTDGSYTYYAANGRYSEVVSAPLFSFGGAQTLDILLYDQLESRGTQRLGGLIDVKAAPYNAKGDGTSDDSAAVANACAAALVSTVGTLYFPAGTYKINTGTQVCAISNVNGITIAGAGRDVTIIKQTGAGAGFVMSGTVDISYGVIRDLTLDGNSTGSKAVTCDTCKDLVVERTRITGWLSHATEFTGANSLHNTLRDNRIVVPAAAASGTKNVNVGGGNTMLLQGNYYLNLAASPIAVDLSGSTGSGFTVIGDICDSIAICYKTNGEVAIVGGSISGAVTNYVQMTANNMVMVYGVRGVSTSQIDTTTFGVNKDYLMFMGEEPAAAKASLNAGFLKLNNKLTLAAFVFANIGTVLTANGDMGYCSDCTIANPCAGGGTGALAKRLNGVWVCN